MFGGALIFGRLFCSWGCHFGATQDLAAWVLRKIGWKPPLVRTRFLHQAPYLVLLAIFVLPLADRWRAGAGDRPGSIWPRSHRGTLFPGGSSPS